MKSTLVLAYAIGHRSVIVLAGTSTEISEMERAVTSPWHSEKGGGLVILGGIYLIMTTLWH
jgi:cytochrome c biogenesis protein CcdA